MSDPNVYRSNGGQQYGQFAQQQDQQPLDPRTEFLVNTMFMLHDVII